MSQPFSPKTRGRYATSNILEVLHVSRKLECSVLQELSSRTEIELLRFRPR